MGNAYLQQTNSALKSLYQDRIVSLGKLAQVTRAVDITPRPAAVTAASAIKKKPAATLPKAVKPAVAPALPASAAVKPNDDNWEQC